MPFEAIWKLVLVPKHPKKNMNLLHCARATREHLGSALGAFKECLGSVQGETLPELSQNWQGAFKKRTLGSALQEHGRGGGGAPP
jgi:hypothetical protein